MSALKYIAAAAIVAAPMLLASAPAEAITARQQALQGHGIYTTSKGVPQGYSRGYRWHRHHRHWGWRHHRRHYGY